MSDDSAFSDLLTQFSSVTGVQGDRAKFYLESAAWDLQVALASFYEDDSEILETESWKSTSSIPTTAPGPTGTAPESATGKNAPRVAPPSKFATIDSLKKVESSSDEEEGQAFYAGGSERSGQQVIGPGKKKKDIVSEMFKSALDHGAEVVDSGQEGPRTKFGPFKGAGYRLGASETDSTGLFMWLQCQNISASSSNENRVATPQPKDVVLKLWKDGFSLDDGSLRDYQDPANQTFLNSIRNGEIPAELIRLVRGAEVTLSMEDHRSEAFIHAKANVKAFTGAGHKLGSPAPTPVFDLPVCDMPAKPELAESDVKVDSDQPTTNVQIRLADGSRITAGLNHTHTVGDLYAYITSTRPEYASSVFVLMTTFPNRELENREATLKDEDLLNAVIVQRLK
uniref:Uncharacterized protein n=1 Tax=Strigamia maritima TaxID=126957 RepID=T1JGY3_STRMM